MSPIEDELAIRALAAAYSDAVNRGAFEEMAEVYAPDGVLVAFGNPEIKGRENIREVIGKTIGAFQWIFQMTHSGLVRLEGDTATCRWWVSENALHKSGSMTVFLGLYQDHVVRTPQGWRFARRQLDATFNGRTQIDGKTPARPEYLPGLWPR